MKAKKIKGVPPQIKGAFQDTESYIKDLKTEIAEQKFAILKERFFSVNQWKDYCGKGSADFCLYDKMGQQVDRKPITGDFIRIKIPGPGDLEADGFDWVEIINIDNGFSDDDTLESCLITCRPSRPPASDNPNIAHFFSSESTSTFMISKGVDYIKVGVYLRNERPNANTGFLNRIRNFFISLAGDVRFTKLQWKSFADGLLDF